MPEIPRIFNKILEHPDGRGMILNFLESPLKKALSPINAILGPLMSITPRQGWSSGQPSMYYYRIIIIIIILFILFTAF